MLGLVVFNVLLNGVFDVLVGFTSAVGGRFSDEGFGHLASVRVRDWDNGAVGDVGMAEEMGF